MRDIIINLQKSGTWKVQLTIAISFISSKVVNQEHSQSHNTEFMNFDGGNDVVEENFSSHFLEIQTWFRNMNEK